MKKIKTSKSTSKKFQIEPKCSSLEAEEAESGIENDKMYLIMSLVAQYLPTMKDLVSARLVCKTWNDAMIPQIQKRAGTIRFSSYNLARLRKFLSMASKSDQLLFTKYVLQQISFESRAAQQLFKKIGQSMKCLKITLDNPNDMNPEGEIPLIRAIVFKHCLNLREFELEQLMALIVSQDKNTKMVQGFSGSTAELPNLKKLKYSLTTGRVNQGFFADLIHNAPHLHHLDINDVVSKEDPERSTIEACSAISQKSFNLNKLKVLKLRWLNNEILQFLNNCSARENHTNNNRLALMELHLTNCKSTTNTWNLDFELTKSLGTFLRSQSNTLAYLGIEARINVTLPQIYSHLPSLPQLQKFILDTCPMPGFDDSTNQLSSYDSIPLKFPKLSSLTYSGLKFESSGFVRQRQLKYGQQLSLRELVIDHVESMDQLVHLGKMFPNLLHLKLQLDDVYLVRRIWIQWPALVSLSVKEGSDRCTMEVLDSLITGVPREIVVKIRRKYEICRKFDRSIFDHSLPALMAVKTKPGISDLKDLRSLELRLSNITDVSIYYGIAAISNKFKALDVYDRSGKNISRTAREFMSQMLKLE